MEENIHVMGMQRLNRAATQGVEWVDEELIPLAPIEVDHGRSKPSIGERLCRWNRQHKPGRVAGGDAFKGRETDDMRRDFRTIPCEIVEG